LREKRVNQTNIVYKLAGGLFSQELCLNRPGAANDVNNSVCRQLFPAANRVAAPA